MNQDTLNHACNLAGDVADARRSLERVWAQFEPGLLRVARRMTDDADLSDDLLQEARILLWKTDSTRFALDDESESAYLRRTLINRMKDVIRIAASR
jgi:DNA-directed RNA polymerase specialized sigma24 family protein